MANKVVCKDVYVIEAHQANFPIFHPQLAVLHLRERKKVVFSFLGWLLLLHSSPQSVAANFASSPLRQETTRQAFFIG